MALRELSAQEMGWVVGGRGTNPALMTPSLSGLANLDTAFPFSLGGQRPVAALQADSTATLPTDRRAGSPALEASASDDIDDGEALDVDALDAD